MKIAGERDVASVSDAMTNCVRASVGRDRGHVGTVLCLVAGKKKDFQGARAISNMSKKKKILGELLYENFRLEFREHKNVPGLLR